VRSHPKRAWFGIAADDADVGALLLFQSVEKPSFGRVEGKDIEAFRRTPLTDHV